MSDAAKTTTRVQFEFSPEAYARLQRLKSRTEASSYSEVCKSALRLNAALLQRVANGDRLFMKDEQGNMTELVILM